MKTAPSLTKQRAIEALVDFAGPLGPLQSFEARLKRRSEWVTEQGQALTAALLEIATEPLDGESFGSLPLEDLEVELRQLLVLSGRTAPETLLEALGAHLENKQARPVLIEAIGELGMRKGIAWLRPLVDETLTEDERVRLAGALGEIGGPEARELLLRMRRANPEEMMAAHEEIERALKAC